MKPEYYQKIWTKVLSSEESIKFEFGISKKYIRISLIIWGIISFFTLPFFGLGILFFLYAFIRYKFYAKAANAYAFTNKRILIHKGWLSTSLTSIDYDKITDIKISEGFLERLLYKSGSMTINTAGTSAPEAVLRNIDQPFEIKKQLEKIRLDYN